MPKRTWTVFFDSFPLILNQLDCPVMLVPRLLLTQVRVVVCHSICRCSWSLKYPSLQQCQAQVLSQKRSCRRTIYRDKRVWFRQYTPKYTYWYLQLFCASYFLLWLSVSAWQRCGAKCNPKKSYFINLVMLLQSFELRDLMKYIGYKVCNTLQTQWKIRIRQKPYHFSWKWTR